MRTGAHPRIKSEGMLRLKTLLFAVGGHLLLERGQLGERRIGIDRTIALARGGARSILPMRRTVFPAAAVAAASVTALVAPALIAIAGLAFVPLLFAALAFETLARPAIFVLAHFTRRRAVGSGRNCRRAFAGRSGLGSAEILVTVAPALPVPFALGAIAGFAGCGFSGCGFAGGGGLHTIGGPPVAAMMLPIAIVARRPPLIGPATGAPDLDQFGLGGCRGCGCFSWRGLASRSGFTCCFHSGRRFSSGFGGNFRDRRGFHLHFDGNGRALRNRLGCERDMGQQRRR